MTYAAATVPSPSCSSTTESGVAGKGACYLDAPDMAPLPAGPSRGAGELDDGAGCGQPAPKSSAVAISVLYRSRSAAWRSTGGVASAPAGTTVASVRELPSAGRVLAGGVAAAPAGATISGEPPSERGAGNIAMAGCEGNATVKRAAGV